LFPAYLLSQLELDPAMLGRLSRLANEKCEALQKIVKAKDQAVALLGQQPAIPRIDNKSVCADCHMKRAGGPPDGFNTSDAEFMSQARERKSSHPSWCPGVCIRKFCLRKHGESLCECVCQCYMHHAVHADTSQARDIALFKTAHAERKEQMDNLSTATRTCKAILDFEKARTGSTNGKKSQLQNGIRNANEFRSIM
jgi:hypothetical protein